MSREPAQETFVAESRDLLFSMEQALLRLEKSPTDRDAINTVFGAAHTIKGAAGMFGFDAIVEFTHAMEGLLEKVRSGTVPVGDDLIALLLACGDHVSALIDVIASGEEQPATAEGRSLLERLYLYLGPTEARAVASARDASSSGLAGRRDDTGGASAAGAEYGDHVVSNAWHISLRFGRDVLRNGMDPLSIFRYLGTFGEIVSITTLVDRIPPAEEMDPESCYLGVEIDFRSDADKRTIEQAFEFIRDDCAIRILPPHSRIGEYIELINALPEDKKRLGELLTASGTLTQRELEEGLARQRGLARDAAGPQRKLGEILVEQRVVQTELVDAALQKQAHRKETALLESNLIRVQADKLDQLINLVGELVIAGASTAMLARRLRNDELHENASTLERLVGEIRESALQLRTVQIGETFNRFARKVRDVSHELNKDVELIVSGADTELDKSVVDKIGDPLLHLIRNAIDHGIEPVDVRRERGKPPKGTVRLNAYHDSGNVVIEVADDGGGIDKEKIHRKAIESGLVSANQPLTDQELFGMVFQAGFSTADQVTNLSGRGVGMDVVRRAIEGLRGTVHIESEPGVGTTVRMRLPLTLAIIDGFLVGVDATSWVIPLGMVSECVELSAERHASSEREYINLRGDVLPLVRLRDQFNVTGKRASRESVVVVQYAGRRAGLVVDKLFGEFQTVIKPLARVFRNLKGITGSTILGTGDVALILDVPALVQRAIERERARTNAAATAA